MRDSGLLTLRLTLGGYLAVHGAQKLFGHFDGPGLDNAGVGFEHMGLRPGKPFATLAATSELLGGMLTATGLAYPVGPIAVAGAMAVATAVHSDKGAMGQKGGYELPLTNVAAAVALALTGPGRYSLDAAFGLRLPRGVVRLVLLGAAGLSGYSAYTVLKHKRSGIDAPPAADPGPVPAPAEREPAGHDNSQPAAEAIDPA